MARSFLLVLALLSLPAVGQAQRRALPFETLDLGLTVLGDINSGVLHRWWSPGLAVSVGAATPFYLGTIELGLQYAHPTALRNDVPGFRSLFLYAGWGGSHRLGGAFTAGAGARVGIMSMRFDGDTLPDYRRGESELGVVGRALLRWMPGHWFAEASMSYQSVLTYRHMEQVFLSVGVGRRFATPPWLRDFLD